jgi:hypothetical protein
MKFRARLVDPLVPLWLSVVLLAVLCVLTVV